MELLSWQQDNRCHFISFVKNVSLSSFTKLWWQLMEVDRNSHLIQSDPILTEKKCSLKCQMSSPTNLQEAWVRLGLG